MIANGYLSIYIYIFPYFPIHFVDLYVLYLLTTMFVFPVGIQES